MIMDGSLHLHIYFYGIAWTLPCNNRCTMWLYVAWELELNLWLVYLWTLLVSLMFYQFGLWFNSYMNLWLIPLASCCYLGCVCVWARMLLLPRSPFCRGHSTKTYYIYTYEEFQMQIYMHLCRGSHSLFIESWKLILFNHSLITMNYVSILKTLLSYIIIFKMVAIIN
jgi:hypothetical protein